MKGNGLNFLSKIPQISQNWRELTAQNQMMFVYVFVDRILVDQSEVGLIKKLIIKGPFTKTICVTKFT